MNLMNFVARLPARLTGITFWGAALTLGFVACSQNTPPESSPPVNPAASAPAPAATTGATTGATTPATTTGTPAAPAAAPAAGATPAPVVSVITVKVEKRDVPVTLKAVGSAVSLASVDIRPQVTSAVTQVHFKEGQFVNKGDLLFTLDTRTDETNLAKAKAQLAKDQAALADAKRQLTRSRELVAQNFVSGAAVDTAQTLVDSSAAVVASDTAAVQAAQVALSYGKITAPHSGRTGVINTPVGSIVQANITVMANVVQVNPIAVSFNLPQRDLADFLAAATGTEQVKVTATLPEDKKPLIGKLQFVDNAVDPASGTVKLKAVFNNKDSKLWPGLFVNVGLTTKKIEDALVVPQAAIIQSVRGPIVYVVEDGKAVVRPIKMVYPAGPEAAVTGVQENDVLVVDGKQNLRPGVKVVERPKENKEPGKDGGAAAPGGNAQPAAANAPATPAASPAPAAPAAK
jgi:RND family efflux transporter MFP subunit